ncbi:hypothetical protein Cni_G22521 [Canna indica]|uniref:Uncharacterized protein n=1 Tax=Canna indica TaxID=4628 RepID=A0AAQ3KRJ7_9LILI|nr:hypothetical protein Cni_G22521 [Canna indica]
MSRNSWALRRLSSQKLRPAPYPIPSHNLKISEEDGLSKRRMTLERRDWEDATCSVCMESPHNAVLLLCSSHDKGCRPYMCGTSYRHSHCLNQFKKAYMKSRISRDDPSADSRSLGLNLRHSSEYEKSEMKDLACPLCRGKVKGWTVVVPAREFLNYKKRSCMQENCSFVGTYKELRKHVRSEHPSAKPHEVDPVLEDKWRVLEHERERQDVISTIRTSMPRSVVFGDYVIELNSNNLNNDDELGDGQEDADWESRGISRSILYFFLRHSSHLLRLNGEDGEFVARGEDEDYVSVNNDAADAFSLDVDDDVAPVITQGGEIVIQRSGRRNRRHQRNRGTSVSDL